MMEGEEEEEDFSILAAAAYAQVAANQAAAIALSRKLPKRDHRTLPRNKRTVYHHDEALGCIQRDYLGPSPIFDGREFDSKYKVQMTNQMTK